MPGIELPQRCLLKLRMQLDLIDEWHLGLHPLIANEGTQLFDDVPSSYRLDLISSTPIAQTGILELQYRRHR